MIGWSLFLQETNSISEMMQQVGRLFSNTAGYYHETISSLSIAGYLPYLVLALMLSTPIRKLFDRIAVWVDSGPNVIRISGTVLNDIGLIAVFLLCLAYICIGSSTYFLFFSF